MTGDSRGRSGVQAILSGDYVPERSVAVALIVKLDEIHRGVAHEAVAQDAPLFGSIVVPPHGTAVLSLDVSREVDFLVRGISVWVGLPGLPVSVQTGKDELVHVIWGASHRRSEYPLHWLRHEPSGDPPKVYSLIRPKLVTMCERVFFEFHSHNGAEQLEYSAVLHGLRLPVDRPDRAQDLQAYYCGRE